MPGFRRNFSKRCKKKFVKWTHKVFAGLIGVGNCRLWQNRPSNLKSTKIHILIDSTKIHEPEIKRKILTVISPEGLVYSLNPETDIFLKIKHQKI